MIVIDSAGVIQYVNHAWLQFARENGGNQPDTSWLNQNYLNVCDQAAASGDEMGRKAAAGIRKVIANPGEAFYLEYPCHTPNQYRWFMMRITSFSEGGKHWFVIAHNDITERKLAEERVEALSRQDSLTGISNRRNFTFFLDQEWRRCRRNGRPIALAMIDIDHFKLFNDRYGHQAGDDALISVANSLSLACQRPTDHCARYGGEEFIIVLGNTDLERARPLVEDFLERIRELDIPNEDSPDHPILTASAGLTSLVPSAENSQENLVESADKLLYEAKHLGRDQLVAR
ncbi:diguanylate cyclase (GGDEF)-like protein [Natronospira proteinivora]|uniref:diguanylate cyclase n=1 Tax=Natronospira proteinivora TaxID=1807133 RepID=A0ABT1G7D1_9GAMM|nr:GGDEF domain-containing protein [Natronospira proteinivora]MCP1727202.1 diguanylate cyclase (GGDEF)-like protein [Natronospira proteinivora]